MAVAVKVLFDAKFAEATQTVQFTSATPITLVDKFTATNNGASPASISVNIVKAAASAGTSNLIVAQKTLLPNQTYTFPEIVGQALAVGDMISTIASAANAITIRASGREIA